jgi:hypothetical protein
MSWASKEFKTVQLGDKRLESRVIQLAEQLGGKPTASIPKACGGWAETQAAYRFLSQEDLEWNDLMSPHWECTHKRMSEHKVVLCLQDTTELNFNGQEIEGLGPLSHEAQRGLYLHPTYAVTPEREPLGVVDAWMWTREFKDSEGVRGGLKESRRWMEGYRHIAQWAGELPATRLVYVADRESDILELMVLARDLDYPADYVLRSCHNRALPNGGKLWEEVSQSESLGRIRFTLPSRKGQKAREVIQTLHAKRVELSDGLGGRFQTSCVIAKEEHPPAGAKPIEWRLLTNRVIGSLEEAGELLDWYRARWEIELFFHVLKNGCTVETLQLSTVKRLELALVLYMVIAWRIGLMMRLGRTCPELSAELLLEREEWQAAFILNKKRPPKQVPTLNQVIRLIAKLGGFLGRKGDGEPGVKTIWQGLQRVMDVVIGMHLAKEMPWEN